MPSARTARSVSTARSRLVLEDRLQIGVERGDDRVAVLGVALHAALQTRRAPAPVAKPGRPTGSSPQLVVVLQLESFDAGVVQIGAPDDLGGPAAPSTSSRRCSTPTYTPRRFQPAIRFTPAPAGCALDPQESRSSLEASEQLGRLETQAARQLARHARRVVHLAWRGRD